MPLPPHSPVYDTLWKFAHERQNVFFRKARGEPPPWTQDPIIARHKFTNAYRASDRVSQYLIRNIILAEPDDPPDDPEEIFFRIILFKTFNKIETWKLLEKALGPLSHRGFPYEHCSQVLSSAMAQGKSIYSAAYIMPSVKTAFGHPEKHRNHLQLLQNMMEDRTALRIQEALTMQESFELLRSYPGIGGFLAYQYCTDLNYSTLTNFSEMEFVTPGPGAWDGLRKCFPLLETHDSGLIRMITENQDEEFEKRGLEFQSLWGRPLQLIDCQNLLCEVSKYARVSHPHIAGTTGRTRIKQQYRENTEPIELIYPPKWGINHLIEQAPRTDRPI